MSKPVNEWVKDSENQVNENEMATGRKAEQVVIGTLEEMMDNGRLFFTIMKGSDDELAEQLQPLGKTEQELELERE